MTNSLLAAGSLAVACAVLSIFVVLRRWAFIGEGIGHSGFGGAGTAWLAALLVPALDGPGPTYAFVVAFCLLTAVAVGALSRARPGRRVNADAAIGIFLVASLAWGFVAQQIYFWKRGAMPWGFETYLFGRMSDPGGAFALAAASVSAAVLITVFMLWDQIISYCFDPLMAQTSGVRAGLVHYLLMLMLALVIVIGVRVAGVLVTALLVLPGSTALVLARRLGAVVACAVAIALVGAVGGLAVNATWKFLPVGPSIVLILFLEFVIAYALGAVAAARHPAA